MRQYPWIAGVMWDLAEFAKEEGLTSVERALTDAIKAIELETGPDPRVRTRRQQGEQDLPEIFGCPQGSAENQEPTLGKPRWKQ